jgi:hypothetical protein
MSETTGSWIVLDYFPHSPVQVYGSFTSEDEARAWAEKNRLGREPNAFQVVEVLNAFYSEDPSDYAGMGWVGRDGRP